MLRDVMQPFAVCARTVLLNVSIIASISAILLLIVRYIFLRICLSDETGLPYAQDSLVFGFAATNLGRAVALAPMARRKLLIHPLVDQVGITIIGTSSNVLMWMSQASWGGIDFVYKSCIPVFVITGFLTSWTINSAKQVSVLAEIFYHFTNSIAFVVLYSCYMCVSVLCFHISNQRVVVFMNRIEVTLSERILGYVYNLLLLGVGFPMLRYILIFLNKSVIVAWRAPKPTSRPQEIATNASKLVFLVSQDAMWNSIGNIVIFRSQGYLFYYLGTVGFQMAYAVERLIACYSLRRKLRKQQIRVEPDTIVKEDVKSDESDMVKQVEEGAAVNAFEPNRLRRVTLVKRPTMSSRMSRRSSRKDDVGRSHYSKRDSHVSDNDSVVSGIPLGVRAAGFNEEELPDYPPARTERGDVQLPLTEEETTIINLQAGDDESDLFGIDVPFTALDERVTYGYLRIGTMIAEWSSRCVSFFIVLFFIALPDFAKWTKYYGPIPVSDLIIRLVTWPLFALLCEFLCTYAESRILDLDFALSVSEFNSSGLSVTSFTFVIGLLCGSVGPLLIAEMGLLTSNPLFQPGRRMWALF